MTSATDNRTTELREKLTERGVEWVAREKECHLTLEGFFETRWDANGVRWSYLEINGKATLSVVGRMEIELTPEQAIAATLGEQIVRCRDCKHATISTTGVCKYCEMFVLPDVDGYGADPQVNLPLDFFCGFAERKEVG